MGTKPDMPLTDKEKEEVKKIVLVWRKRQLA
jgi:hypothetical protein